LALLSIENGIVKIIDLAKIFREIANKKHEVFF